MQFGDKIIQNVMIGKDFVVVIGTEKGKQFTERATDEDFTKFMTKGFLSKLEDRVESFLKKKEK